MFETLYCRLPTNWLSDPSQCWFEWQTLISGILAVVAAGATVLYLKKQISQSDTHEQGRLRRQHSAVRATLPLTLSGLVEVMRKMLLALDGAKTELVQTSAVANFQGPSPPTAAIAELQQIILSTDDPSVIEPTSEAIREMQTLWARTDVLYDQGQQAARAGLSVNIDEWIIQAAKIHALIESLFDYARCETGEGPRAVGWGRAESILMQLYVHDAKLKNMIEQGHSKAPDFWRLP